VITDDELLRACRFGGERGALVYRKAVLEWQARDLAWRRDRSARIADIIGEALREAADSVWMSVVIRRGLGGC
jgi:hypothetical protein